MPQNFSYPKFLLKHTKVKTYAKMYAKFQKFMLVKKLQFVHVKMLLISNLSNLA